MNQRHDPDDNSNANDPTLDRLLQQAFASRGGGDGHASLIDVRNRARMRQRRRAGAMVGAAAIVGAGGVGVLTRGSNDATTTAGDAATTTAATGTIGSCSGPAGVLPTVSTIEVIEPTTSSQSEATTTTFDPTGTSAGAQDTAFGVPPSGSTSTLPADGVPPEAYATTTWPDGVTTTTGVDTQGGLSGCLPPGAFRCSAPLGSDDQGFTYYAFCEPADGGWTAYPTTTTVDPSNFGGIVIVDSSGGLDGAANDMVDRLEGTGLGVITVVPGTRPVEQTMLMPMGDRSGLDIVMQLTGIDGFDTWTPDMINGPLPEGTLAVVVIGQDYWTRDAPTGTTVPPATFDPTVQTTTTSITG